MTSLSQTCPVPSSTAGTARAFAPVLLLALATALPACAKKAPPSVAPAAPGGRAVAGCPAGACRGAKALALALAATFARPETAHAVWSVRIDSLDRGDTVFAHGADTLVAPASNMKIVTVAAAATRLGWDFRFETRLESAAPVVDGTLAGDLFVVGGGDPGMNGRSGHRDEALDELARALLGLGVTRIAGRVVGDDNAFREEPFGQAWSWDDFAYGYAAPIGALQYNENLVDVRVRPGAVVGDPVSIALDPPTSDLVPLNEAVTSGAGTESTLDIRRFPGERTLRVTGALPAGAAERVLHAAVVNPTVFFATALKSALQAHGIVVTGDSADIDDLDEGAVTTPRRVLARHASAPLSDLARPLMKVSQNLYAETFFRALSLGAGPANVEASRDAEREVLDAWGIPRTEYAISDGSGLSRMNVLSASLLVRVLSRVANDARLFPAFEATLPIGGVDGSLAARFKGTAADGNVKAKTGTLTGVRSLSGYVTSRDRERFVFSIVANHFTSGSASVDVVADEAVALVAAFSRADRPHSHSAFLNSAFCISRLLPCPTLPGAQ